MAAVDDILQSLPIDQLAQQVGADPQEVQQAAQAALPALLGGLQANAQDPGGASSIVEALGQHDDDLLRGGVNLGQVDESDGQRIASHIFGSNEEQVYSALGSSSGASGGLVRRLIPILAPIVLSYLANRVLKGGGGGLGGGLGGGGRAAGWAADWVAADWVDRRPARRARWTTPPKVDPARSTRCSGTSSVGRSAAAPPHRRSRLSSRRRRRRRRGGHSSPAARSSTSSADSSEAAAADTPTRFD